jgi:hypothetical protein
MARLYLGRSPKGVDERSYIKPPQELFEEAILWLGRQLGQVHDA